MEHVGPFTCDPVHPGIYLRNLGGGLVYARWTGSKWMAFNPTAAGANSTKCVSGYQSNDQVPWYGCDQPS
jgi:hypothetical protein